MSEDDDVAEYSGATREMADALIALRRTPIRSGDSSVESLARPPNDVNLGVADDEDRLRESRYVVSDPFRSWRANEDYLAGCTRTVTTRSTIAPATITAYSSAEYRGDWSAPPISVFGRNTATPRGTVSWLDTSSPRMTTASLSLPASSVVVDSRIAPIASVITATERPIYSSTERSEIVRLEERLAEGMRKHMESLLAQVLPAARESTSPKDATEQRYVRQDFVSSATPASARRPGGYPSSASSTDRDRPEVAKPFVPHIKLGVYRGESSLETFLAKFENCSQFTQWSDRERLFYLRNALEGVAGQVLWDVNAGQSVEALIRLLRNRFGNQNQMERYRAELKARRRQPGESLQKLYQDICRLMALAHPGQSNELSDTIAKDAFLDALGDVKFRREILIQQPQDLDAALSIAVRLEAYDRDPNEQRESEVNGGRGKNKYVRATRMDEAAQHGQAVDVEWSKRMAQMESGLEDVKQMLSQFQQPRYLVHTDNAPQAQPVQLPSSPSSFVVTRAPQQQPSYVMQAGNTAPAPSMRYATDYRPQGGRNTRYVARDVCKNCFQKGHWRKFCPLRSEHASVVSQEAPRSGDVRANTITGEVKGEMTAVYLKIKVNGRAVHCLLDSGCERSVINSRLISDMEIEPSQQRLFAANGTEVPVLGTVKMDLIVHGTRTVLNALVSEAVEDVILGIDWLTAYSVQWNFGSKTIVLDGKRITLSSRPLQNLVRRLYVTESVVVPPGHMVDVPVMATLRDLHAPKTEWATDVRQLKKNVLAARTLVDAAKTTSAVRVINMGNRACELSVGQFVATARPVEIAGEFPESNADVEETAPKISGNGTEFSANRNLRNGAEYIPRNDSVPEHVTCLLESLPAELSEEQREAVKEFVCANADVFSKSEYDIGRTHLVRHRIDTGDHPPFREQLRRHPMAYWPIIDQQVEEMLAHDIIEPTASPWASNVVLVKRKADDNTTNGNAGKVRFCLDYRRLNDVTRKDSYPLPRIEDCLSALGGARYFSTLDLRSGYWQTAMDERDADKTAFITRRGVFRFKVLSFGLANAPALFQRLMDYVLAGLTWEICLVYLDDIIIWASSFEDHLLRLTRVLQRLRDANLKLKPSKCRLFQHKVGFLGHVVSAAGIEPDPEKIKCVAEWPVPCSLTAVRAFTGLASYYRKHVKGFADIARPLHELTRKREPFVWNERRQQSFEQLKRCLTTAPLLAAPLDHGRYVLDTDASNIGLGAVLQQEQPDGLRVIAYASRALSRAELSYCTTKKEMLAVTYGLKVFRQYLLAREFLLRTDHSALTHLQRTPEPIGQQARWLDLIAEFNFTIMHRSGESNRNADGLSRQMCAENCRYCSRQINVMVLTTMPRSTESDSRADDNTVPKEIAVGDQQEMAEEPALFICAAKTSPAPEPLVDAELFTMEALKQAQEADETIMPVMAWLREANGRPEWKQLETLSEDTRTLWGQFDSLRLINDVLHREFCRLDGSVDHVQIVVPRTLRTQFLKLVHEGAGGHFALKRTQEQVQRRAYWPGWRRTVEQFIRRCLPCAQYQGSKPVRQGVLQSFEANGPGDRYCIDLVGAYPKTRRGKKYILTVLDAYTRYLICVPLPEKTAVNVARALIEEVFFKISCPRSIQSDLGTEFQNSILDSLCKILGVQKLKTTVHRPCANGRCERSHKTIAACLAKLVAVNQTDWDEKLQLVTFAMNCARNESTGYSPFELMYGRLPRMPVDLVLDLPGENYPTDLDQYAEEFAERLREANKMVLQHTRSAFARMKRNYDAKVRDKDYAVGQFVLFYYPRRYRGRNPKLARQNIGPFRILRRLNDVNFVIAMTPRSRQMIVHIDKLKPWCGEEPQCWIGIEPVSSETREGCPRKSDAQSGTEVSNEAEAAPLNNLFDSHDCEPDIEPPEVEVAANGSAAKSVDITVRKSRIPVWKSVLPALRTSSQADSARRDEIRPEREAATLQVQPSETVRSGDETTVIASPVVMSSARGNGRPTRKIRPPRRYQD